MKRLQPYWPGAWRNVGQWPQYQADCQPHEVPKVRLALREYHLRAWEEATNQRRYLRDHHPDAWERMKICRTVITARDTQYGPRVEAEGCEEPTWCPACADVATMKRVAKAIGRIWTTTPVGKAPRLQRWVISANLEEEGASWGVKALKRRRAFRDAFWRFIERWHGPGCGGIVSYHDFGERGVAKFSPHIDATISARRIVDGQVIEMPVTNTRNGSIVDISGGRKQKAMKMMLEEIEADFGPAEGRIDIYTRPVEEQNRIALSTTWFVLKYQLRQLFDVRKVIYIRRGADASQSTVTWDSGKEQFLNATLPIQEFEARAQDHLKRTKGPDRCTWHMGHMSDDEIADAATACGRVHKEHGKKCRCRKCNPGQVEQSMEVRLTDEEESVIN